MIFNIGGYDALQCSVYMRWFFISLKRAKNTNVSFPAEAFVEFAGREI